MSNSLSYKFYMYLYALTFNNYGPAIPDHVHEYYTSISSEYYRPYFLMNRNYETPQHVKENVYYG